MPVLGSLWLLVLLLFVDNATVSAFSTPLLLLNGHHFEPWQVALLGGTAATLGSVLQFVWLRWIVAGERPWMPRLAPSRAALERALAAYPRASLALVLLARATPMPDAPVKLAAAAGGLPVWQYGLAAWLGTLPYYFVLAWLGTRFHFPPGTLLCVLAVVFVLAVLEHARRRSEEDDGE